MPAYYPQDTALAICLMLLIVGPLLVWRSRYNVPSILKIGFSIVAFGIPIIFVGSQYSSGRNAYNLFEEIIFLGTIPYLLGIYIGYLATAGNKVAFLLALNLERKQKAAVKLALIAIVGMIFTYALMGFIPAFAADPRAAKFLRGAYQLSGGTNALYRLFTSMADIALPLVLALAIDKKSKFLYMSAFLLFSIFMLNMTRAPAGFPILLVIGILAARANLSRPYIVLMSFIYIFGSLLNFVLGYTDASDENGALFKLIEAGAPDVRDQVWFLSRYIQAHPPLTLGRTFVGGMIPGQNMWNPAVWSLTLGSSDVSVEALNSGGLRLSGPILAYIAFGLWSVPIIMLVSGVITGYFLKITKMAAKYSSSIFGVTLALIFLVYVGGFFSRFYDLRYTDFISVLFVYGVIYRFKFFRFL